jgi:hypothetical protein
MYIIKDMKPNTTSHNCDETNETCERDDDFSSRVALGSGVYLATVGIVSSTLNILALIKATRVNISFI